ncbi:ABC transporter permease [Endozoicomonas sp. SCSIO W0465]|uniref:ABC transporter permease n=1 Tax=Endozoicomonas sp. SCSIO W0465 TaxID=2918516 RepID=UPI002075E349|nr:ABC transporter permease [Endozoicomonas sp. SCSIO W0465]USE33903.1 ABC transporter permease [Endozoicomonas sp. SCSIO W0465]
MFRNAYHELIETYRKKNLVINLAWDDIKVRYARSVIGPFWLVMTTAISALGLGYVWSILFNQNKSTFIPALCIGLVIWQFLSSCIMETPNCFIVNTAIIRNTINPILIYPLVAIIRNLIILAHNFLIIFIVFCLYPPNFGYNTFLIIPGLILVIGNLIWISVILGFLGARYRDLSPAITSMMTILFFLSPVIYKPDQLGLKAMVIWLNPFTYLISAIRDPLTGHASPSFSYVVMTSTLIIGFMVMAIMIEKYRYRIPYWL